MPSSVGGSEEGSRATEPRRPHAPPRRAKGAGDAIIWSFWPSFASFWVSLASFGVSFGGGIAIAAPLGMEKSSLLDANLSLRTDEPVNDPRRRGVSSADAVEGSAAAAAAAASSDASSP